MNGLKVIAAFGIGWAISQVIKLIVFMVRKPGEESFQEVAAQLFKSGGMPSSHAASFGAAMWCLGVMNGFQSEMFALAVCMYIIVIYDAVNVRYAVGEQGKALKKLVAAVPKETREKLAGMKKIEIVEGHTVAQVFVGAMLGCVVGCLVAVLV